MTKQKIILSVAGSDSGAGAGIQADIKAAAAVGGYCATAITAITAQNTMGVQAAYPLDAQQVKEQIDSVMSDMQVEVIKSGMLPNGDIIETLCQAIIHYKIPYVVVDPVMVATSGDTLVESSQARILVDKLLPLATIVTPNIPEAEIMCGFKIETSQDLLAAAQIIANFGAKYVLIKGGHGTSNTIEDMLYCAQTKEVKYFCHPRINSNNTHGTGCSLSSAIAANISLGHNIVDSIQRAIDYISAAIERGKETNIGEGAGPVGHFNI